MNKYICSRGKSYLYIYFPHYKFVFTYIGFIIYKSDTLDPKVVNSVHQDPPVVPPLPFHPLVIDASITPPKISAPRQSSLLTVWAL